MAEYTNLQAALWYAKKGWAVFPCFTVKDGVCSCGDPACTGNNRGKHPVGFLVPAGCKQASRFAGTITSWWNKVPDANIAVACGKPSMGLVVIDVDPQHGGDETYTDLVSIHGPFTDTPQALTGGGGRHLYFHSDAPIPNKVGLFPGIDLRGEGGYVVAPRSSHVSGRHYEWEASLRPETIPVAQLPAWIEEALAQARAPEGGERVDPNAVFGGIPSGERHDQLYRYACRLRSQDRMTQVEAVTLVRGAMLACKPAYTDETPEDMVADVWGRYKAGPSEPVREPRGMVEAIMDEEPSAPVVTTEDRTVRVEWVTRGIVATAKTLKEHSDGRIGGHLTIETTLPGVARALRSAQFTFTALRSRTELANDLKKKVDSVPWDDMIEMLCDEVTRYIQTGDPILEVDSSVEVAPAEFVLWPLVMYKHPTVLFGDPETTKSYLAALIIYLAGLPPQEILDMQVRRTMASPLYLDWEGEFEALASRMNQIQIGMELPIVKVGYRKCKRSLMDDLDQIKRDVKARGTDFVVIDSLGAACGMGNLNDTQPPMEFYAALRSLNVSSLILAHNAKNAPQHGRTVYGNLFFGALARSIWEVKRPEHEEGSDSVEIGLFHTKMNYGRRERPIGFRFHFGTGATLVTPHSPKDIAAATGMMSLSKRILQALRQNGKMSVGQLAEELGSGQETIRVTLYRLRDKQHPPLVHRHEKGLWAALTEEVAQEERKPWEALF